MNEALAIVEREMAPTPAVLFRDSEPAGIVRQATAIADQLKDVIRDRKLYSTIKGREHVRVEGWCLLGTMLGVFPVPVSAEPLAEGKGYIAHVEARTMAGATVGAAFAICTRDEDNWKERDDFALMSMAQTRATSKALRLPLGFVMALAGYESTPAEEMEPERPSREPMRVTAPQRSQPKAPIEGTARPSGSVTGEQQATLKAEALRLGITSAMLSQLALKNYGSKVLALTEAAAANLIADLAEYQTAADVQEALAKGVELSDPDDPDTGPYHPEDPNQ